MPQSLSWASPSSEQRSRPSRQEPERKSTTKTTKPERADWEGCSDAGTIADLRPAFAGPRKSRRGEVLDASSRTNRCQGRQRRRSYRLAQSKAYLRRKLWRRHHLERTPVHDRFVPRHNEAIQGN